MVEECRMGEKKRHAMSRARVNALKS
jgi:hypothetical protein